MNNNKKKGSNNQYGSNSRENNMGEMNMGMPPQQFPPFPMYMNPMMYGQPGQGYPSKKLPLKIDMESGMPYQYPNMPQGGKTEGKPHNNYMGFYNQQ